MKKALRIVAIGIVVLALVVVVGGFFLPSEFDVEVIGEAQAPAPQLYELAASPRTWVDWSTWNLETMPDMKSTYTGPAAGVGAKWSWTQEMGDGYLEVTKVTPDKRIEYDLVFEGLDAPMKGTLAFETHEGGTRVVWGFSGDVGGDLIWRWGNLFMADMMRDEYVQAIAGLDKAALAAPGS